MSRVVAQPCHACARALGRIRPSVELYSHPPIEATVAQETQGRQKIEIAAIDRCDGEGLALPSL